VDIREKNYRAVLSAVPNAGVLQDVVPWCFYPRKAIFP